MYIFVFMWTPKLEPLFPGLPHGQVNPYSDATPSTKFLLQRKKPVLFCGKDAKTRRLVLRRRRYVRGTVYVLILVFKWTPKPEPVFPGLPHGQVHSIRTRLRTKMHYLCYNISCKTRFNRWSRRENVSFGIRKT